jgi:hypothetical protein
VRYAPPPKVEFPRLDRFELLPVFRGGEKEADDTELGLTMAARVQAATELAIAEGLAALRVGDRLAELGYHLGDYAREVLDIAPRTALNLVHLARELRTRPLLRAALRGGTVTMRAAQTVLPVARGEDEASWVELASRETVRALEEAVKAERAVAGEEEWGRWTVGCTSEDREVVDDALARAGQELPGSKTFERLEAMAQEFLGAFPDAGVEDGEKRTLREHFRSRDEREAWLAQRKAALEDETGRWVPLKAIPPWVAPEEGFDELSSAAEIDAALRALARHREGWDEYVGWTAEMIRRSGMHLILGFTSFRHYVEERLGMPGRAVEQRAVLEEKIWGSPALRAAREWGLSYERLRVLSHLPEAEIRAWTPRARVMTVAALRRELEAAEERQTRARGKLAAQVPRSVASCSRRPSRPCAPWSGRRSRPEDASGWSRGTSSTSGVRRQSRRAARTRSGRATAGTARSRVAATTRPMRITWSTARTAEVTSSRTRSASARSITTGASTAAISP